LVPLDGFLGVFATVSDVVNRLNKHGSLLVNGGGVRGLVKRC